MRSQNTTFAGAPLAQSWGHQTSRHPAVAALLRGLCAKVAARPKQRSLSYG